MGLSKVRFKAEVDFDGRVVTRSYLERQDIDQILNVRTEQSHGGLVHASVLVYILCNRNWAVCCLVVGHSAGEDSWRVGGLYVEAWGKHHRHLGSRGGPTGERAQGTSVLLEHENPYTHIFSSCMLHGCPQPTMRVVCFGPPWPSFYRHYINGQSVLLCMETDPVLSA